ncbi:MAG: class I SAM-dependent methyltransferase [Clostridia bacterium]|nr:class I SAM-dependent methyltransferase [Clostridia bacterium]
MDKKEKIRDHFELEAQEFDEIIRKLIPYYEQMLKALTASIPFGKGEKISVLDLGCGTGTIAKKVKELFPNARISCLDLAKNMVEMAKIKLKNFEDIQYYVGEFEHFEFPEKYDVVVSSLALHHLVTEKDKIHFYSQIHKALNQNGVFYNADVVLGSNSHLQDLYMKKWVEYMKRNVPEEEVESKWMKTYEEEDSPAKLMDHIEWLKKLGFADVDVVWKYYNFAVYGGVKL